MTLTCEVCGALITRKRGNLRTVESWKRAVESLMKKHLSKHMERLKEPR